ncbi:MAG: ABC transporter permease [Devosia sp.]|uniref:ABC transporter permease n=1 Tax=Devosia sp. TaxID=1871048 RepID=UPI001AC9B498|nr:FtsX-like permease family protein [Devosia sp.]MBN9317003.1 ABC transporter permease [Devosia sp.]
MNEMAPQPQPQGTASEPATIDGAVRPGRFVASLIRLSMLDLRGSVRHLWILIACLALGVATVATVGAVGASLQAALMRDGPLLLGGDIEARLTYRPAEAAELALFHRLGRTSEVVDLIGRARHGSTSVLAAVRAVDSAYPLFGSVEVDGAGSVAQLLAPANGTFGVLVGPGLLERLGLGVGGRLGLGKAEFEIRGVLRGVPDKVSQGIAIGYPLLISAEALTQTGIIEPGSLARYRYKIALFDGQDTAAAIRSIEQAFPEAGWHMSVPADATEELSHYLGLLERFLVLVGLSALLVGGLGVAHAAAAYITERQEDIAIMKALGGTRRRVLLHFLIQLLALTLVGIALGIAAGTAIALFALPLLGPAIGLKLAPLLDLPSIAASVAFGLLAGFLFAYLPLSRAETLRPAQLFRSAAASAGAASSWRVLLKPHILVPMLVSAAGLLLVAIADTGQPEAVGWYAAGAVLAFAILRLAAFLMQRGLRLLPPAPNAMLRNALKSIHRPGSPAAAVVLSMGLGLALLLMIALVEDSMRHQLDPQVRIDAPDFIYMDLFDDEVASLEALATSNPRISSFVAIPLVRASSLTINGTSPPELKRPSKDLSVYFGDEQPLTYAATVPDGSRVVGGQWWPAEYHGPPLVSVSDDLRDVLKLKLGDQITFLVFGEPVTATVSSFRTYEWQRGGINFPYVLSPGALDAYPVSYFGLLSARPGEVEALQAELTTAYPALVFLPIEEAIDAVRSLMASVSAAIAVVGAVVFASGVLVLAGALAAGRRRREIDSVIAKVLGATRAELVLGFVIEYGLVGALAGGLAVLLGVAGAWAFVTIVLESGFVANPVLLALVVPVAAMLTIGAGAAITWGALSSSPAAFFRR